MTKKTLTMNTTNNIPTAEVADTLEAIKSYFIYAGIFSAALNVLMLVPIIYMLQVYDRVISSGSYSTLAMLTLIMVLLLSATGGFEWVRSMILIKASNRIEAKLGRRIADATFRRALLTGGAATNTGPLSDLQSLRQFFTGQGVIALFDLPWFPLYIAVMFIFHPWFGIAGLFAGGVLVCLAYLNARLCNEPLVEANNRSNAATARVGGALQNHEVIEAMGMANNLHDLHQKDFNVAIQVQSKASALAAILQSTTKTFRIIVQSLLLGLGALLALSQEISPGMMIAGSLLLGRALAPIDMMVASWRGFSLARAQYVRLNQLLSATPTKDLPMALPEPLGALQVENIIVMPPSSNTVVVRGINFALEPGETLGIVGPSGSGKSCLARALLGVWPTYAGKVRIDGADIMTQDRSSIGPHIGYLPQDIELFTGTVAENIARFGKIDSDKVVEAARHSGVHELILGLPSGYDTVIGASMGQLSGGQRQRLGLARAIYGNPKLLLLDEPDSNLDDAGQKELLKTIGVLREKKCTVIVITHQTKLLINSDKILVMKNGAAAMFGESSAVLSELAGKK